MIQNLQKKQESPLHHYHQSDTLLFQFILHEFLDVYSVIIEIQNCDIEDLKQKIATIAGATRHQMRIFTWNLEDSPLAKLKNYCAYFSQNTEIPEKQRRTLRRQTNQLWLLGIESLDYLYDHKQPLKKQEKKELLEIIEIFNDMAKKIASLLQKIFMQYSDNENIVYFLLQHNRVFDQLYGPNTTLKTLTKMFGSIRESEKFLIKEYQKRQFHHLVTMIQAHYDRLCT